MRLSKANLKEITAQPGLEIPDAKLLELPEKVLQFGTGVLLRGLPDYFIDKANKKGIFNGRVVIVKSTSKGGTDAFADQNGLYTISVKGIEDGKNIEETIINASVSRVLSASEEWKDILQCAHNAEMKLIISNTTEVGIVASDDDISQSPPPSFPGKLLAFLHERFKAFAGSKESGMVIIPTELIINNADKLKSIVFDLAEKNRLDAPFINWLKESNHFCNSLVDRIVPGKLPATDTKLAEEQLGYSDELMIMAEPFRLWAIESDSTKVKEVLSFSQVDDGIVIAPDIEKFRELKLRLLNGTHTFSCGIALIAGFATVKEAMANETFASYVRKLMLEEIVPVMEGKSISNHEACAFASKVTDRFSNPFLEHKWISISMNYTSKMKMRNVPLLQQYADKKGKPPVQMALGFAAYLVFMKCSTSSTDNKRYNTEINGQQLPVEDESAAYFAEKWEKKELGEVLDSILSDTGLWGADLTKLPGFVQAVRENIIMIQKDGVMSVISNRHHHQSIE